MLDEASASEGKSLNHCRPRQILEQVRGRLDQVWPTWPTLIALFEGQIHTFDGSSVASTSADRALYDRNGTSTHCR